MTPPKVALWFALLTACVVDPTGTTEQEIVGGTQTTATTYPTVVALQRSGNFFCSGVLVNKDWVLTAATCFDSTAATQVRIGDSNLGDGTTSGLTINVATINKHPQFSLDDTVWRHDVALLKLATPVTDRTPTSIGRTAAAVGSSVTQVGFGQNNNNGGGGGVMRSLATTNIDCAGANDSGITNANLLCFNAADGTGSCVGDEGAPALVAGTHGPMVVGIASGGTGTSCTSGYDIYTSLAPELAWIDTLVPPPTDPTPPTNPTNPPPSMNPDGSGSGSGSGSDGRNPDGSDSGSGDGLRLNAACSTGHATTPLVVLVVLAFALVRRRRRAC